MAVLFIVFSILFAMYAYLWKTPFQLKGAARWWATASLACILIAIFSIFGPRTTTVTRWTATELEIGTVSVIFDKPVNIKKERIWMPGGFSWKVTEYHVETE